MKGLQFKIDGDWAHFKKPETNNNPLSHNLIPKTALIGMIGAVLGIEREKMKSLFPQLSEDLLYGVELLKPVKKALFYDFFNFVYFTCPTAFLHTLQGMLFHKFKYPVRNRSYKNRNEYSCGKVDYAVII